MFHFGLKNINILLKIIKWELIFEWCFIYIYIYIYIYIPNPFTTECNTKSIFKLSNTGLNSEFFCPLDQFPNQG